ncbi:hypothetical protein HPP92_007207 [Vanilla planifolia]|uniref:Uncharacterized protein n=1 Tax=Vanilla planifolia TaxID=51239 RepID=A0A835V7H6_VANPL|nr:hypothetical protein HPP92_007207 [Vanilla planifolia]
MIHISKPIRSTAGSSFDAERTLVRACVSGYDWSSVHETFPSAGGGGDSGGVVWLLRLTGIGVKE